MTRTAARGILVACDGTRGPDVSDDGARLRRLAKTQFTTASISAWGASGLFEELQLGKRKQRRLSPRTLLLIYAADLAFRLRWEIEPALAEGQMVIAAPYTATAIALGAAAGLPGPWVKALLRFAPEPALTVCARERSALPGWARRPLAGFGEFCGATLKAAYPALQPREMRRAMAHHFDRMVEHGAARRFERQVLDFIE
jgi:hypothetical protein